MNIKLIAALAAAFALSTTTAQAQVKVSTKGGLKVTSGEHEFKFGGRLQYDYNRAELNGIVDEDNFDVRRARLFASGNLSKAWSFKSQFNLDGDGGDDNIEDLYLRYKGWGSQAILTIGNQKQPFGLEELTSSKDISVLERSALTELFAVGRAEGVQLQGRLKSNNQTYGVGFFFDDTSPEGADGENAGEEFGLAARYTIAPIQTDTTLLHLGIAYRLNEVDDLDVGDFSLEDAIGLEVAAVVGPFHIQAEFFDGDIVAGTPFGDADQGVDGFYIQAGYVLTGELRPYSGGSFKRINPGRKGGAWEIVARFEDGNGDFSDIELGDQVPEFDPSIGDFVNQESSAYTIGVNYYAHKNVRLGVNFTDGDEDAGGSDDGEEIRVRFQFTF